MYSASGRTVVPISTLPLGFELGVKAMTVVQRADAYPISPKEHGVEFLMDHRHLWHG